MNFNTNETEDELKVPWWKLCHFSNELHVSLLLFIQMASVQREGQKGVRGPGVNGQLKIGDEGWCLATRCDPKKDVVKKNLK